MLTHKDTQEIRTIFKEEFNEQYKKYFKFLPTKDLFLDQMAKLVKEIKDARDELAAHSTSHTRIDTDLTDHTTRIENLEHHAGITPTL